MADNIKLDKMVSMELDDEDSMDAVQPYPMADKPRFPYGLCISLTDKELEKLNLDPSSAEVGGIVHLHALARITSVNMREDQDETSCRVEMQIEDLEVESEDAEDAEVDASTRRKG